MPSQCVRQRVTQHHPPFGHSLGARQRHEVLVEGGDHRRAHRSGDDRDVTRCQRDRGQDDVVRRAAERLPLALDQGIDQQHAGDSLAGVDPEGDLATDREPAELRSQHDLQEEAEPEHGDGDAQHDEQSRRSVRDATAVVGGQRPERNGDQGVDDHRCQDELEGRREGRQQVVDDRAVGEHGAPQVSLQQAAHVVDVLDVERLVQPQADPCRFHLLRRRRPPGGREGRVPGDDLDHEERDQGERQQHDHHQDHAANDVAEHQPGLVYHSAARLTGRRCRWRSGVGAAELGPRDLFGDRDVSDVHRLVVRKVVLVALHRGAQHGGVLRDRGIDRHEVVSDDLLRLLVQ
jgi:hypothetical protein